METEKGFGVNQAALDEANQLIEVLRERHQSTVDQNLLARLQNLLKGLETGQSPIPVTGPKIAIGGTAAETIHHVTTVNNELHGRVTGNVVQAGTTGAVTL